METSTKVCNVCKHEKLVVEFYKDNTKSGFQSRCKACCSEIKANDRKKKKLEDLDQVRLDDWVNNLRKNFGLTPERWFAMLEDQDGVCYICKQPESILVPGSDEVRRLSVDHDRSCCPGYKSCGACIRFLLCNSCNVFVGRLEVNKNILNEALQYIGWEI